MKLIYLLTFIFIGTACEDRVTQPTIKYRSTPPISTEPNPETEPSQFRFDGLETVRSVTRTSASLHWKHVDGFHQYHIIQVSDLERKIVATVPAPTQLFKLTGLSPDTNYTFMIRAIDRSGYLDANIVTKTFRTDPWPNFNNQISLSFNSSQNVSFGPSKDYYFQGQFTVSTWFKTSNQVNDMRLFTFHRGIGAGSALGVAFKGDTLQIIYTNDKNEVKAVKNQFQYYDNKWHHIAVTVNNGIVFVMLNGEEFIKINENLAKFGQQPLSLGSLAQIQKGFIGKIDEFALFNKYFSYKELLELYNQGQSMDLRVHSRINNLKHWYQLGDQASDNESIIKDVIGNSNGTPLNIELENFTFDSP